MIRVMNFINHKQIINRECKSSPAGDPRTCGY